MYPLFISYNIANTGEGRTCLKSMSISHIFLLKSHSRCFHVSPIKSKYKFPKRKADQENPKLVRAYLVDIFYHHCIENKFYENPKLITNFVNTCDHGCLGGLFNIPYHSTSSFSSH